ncbi:MAG: sugar transferase [Sulfurovum sp.]|nr:MAG: sugar transferase [Sulfurovum sp.]
MFRKEILNKEKNSVEDTEISNNGSLLIIGNKYTLSSMDIIKIKKKFDNIEYLEEKYISDEKIINFLKDNIHTKDIRLVVFNSSKELTTNIINFFIELQNSISFATFDSFEENILNKIYVPEDKSSINYLQEIQPYSRFAYVSKRVVDYVGALTLLTLTSPVMLYSVYKIKKESKGSILFKQPRVGQNGKDFNCLKFRSMHENSKFDPYTRKNDSRIFPWGEFMRKSRIDELPQLFNVLKGDMHLIGPRAEWNILVKEYKNEIAFYSQRHIVKPGITGWAQVNYPYGVNAKDAREKLMFDLYYIKNWNMWLEFKTVLKTASVVIGKKGV